MKKPDQVEKLMDQLTIVKNELEEILTSLASREAKGDNPCRECRKIEQMLDTIAFLEEVSSSLVTIRTYLWRCARATPEESARFKKMARRITVIQCQLIALIKELRKDAYALMNSCDDFRID